jgi:phosphate transport system substrate-binding protein
VAVWSELVSFTAAYGGSEPRPRTVIPDRESSFLPKRVWSLLAATLIGILYPTDRTCAQSVLSGAGSTFAYPIYGKWIKEFQNTRPDVEIRYEAIGSGAGIRRIFQRMVDFAASDGPLNDEQIVEYKRAHGDSILHFPTVLGAVVPAYNVPELKSELKFTPELLANIYLGKITKWNDPELIKVNPDANLPDQAIVVIYRSDGSGTTYVWTDYLAKVNQDWNEKVGRGTSVDWPVGWGASGNKGVIDVVRWTPYTIAYAELTFATLAQLPYGAVQNSAGRFLKANAASVDAAADATIEGMPVDYRLSITNAPGDDAYPIASYTWLLIPSHFSNQSKGELMKEFLRWALTKGQEIAPTVNYVPLPDRLLVQEKRAIDQIQ